MKHFFLIVLLLLLIHCKSDAQTARIRVNRGASLEFRFNTFDKLQNGISKPDYTEIQVYFKDVNTNNGWVVQVKAAAGYIDITPYFSGVGLPLDILEIQASCIACPVWTKIPLSTSYQTIAEGTWVASDGSEEEIDLTLDISYDCNMGTGKVDFSQYVNDTYIVELDFLLKRKD
jgi:hypothetical protein